MSGFDIPSGVRVTASDIVAEAVVLARENATRLGARISTYPFFDKNLTGFNIAAFTPALAERKGRQHSHP